jgi:hypothetical protein
MPGQTWTIPKFFYTFDFRVDSCLREDEHGGIANEFSCS